MFCSVCGTKVNEGANFCYNCGAKIIGDTAEIAKTEKEKNVPDEFLHYVERKLIESYVGGKEITPDAFYKKANFYEVEEDCVDQIVQDHEAKIEKLNRFIDSIFEECTMFKLDEERETEIYDFGSSLGFDIEEIDELLSVYNKENLIEEKQELYNTCICDYIRDGHTPVERKENAEDYQQEIYGLFMENIKHLETLIKREYEKSKEYDLSQEQIDSIYTEGEKWFPEEAMAGIIYRCEDKIGISKIKEDKRKQEALKQMTFFDIYGTEIGYTKEESNGIAIGKNYRTLFHQLNDNFLSTYNSIDRSKDSCWEPLNKKVIVLLDGLFKAMTGSLKSKGVAKEDILTINYMDVFQYWIPVFEETDYQYNVICYGTEAAEYYRKIRKESRRKLIGGGLGLEGAIKGIATAGAINIMTGAAHSVFNFAGNVKSELKKIKALEKLFGRSMKEKVETVFQSTVRWAYLKELEMLGNYNIPIKSFPLFYDKKKQPTKTSIASLKENPFNRFIYENLIMEYGTNEGIEKLAGYTGIQIEEVKQKWKQKELESRTADGMEFPTVAEKEAYCKERDLYQPLINDIEALNVWVERKKLMERITTLKQMQEPSVKQWKEKRDRILSWYAEIQKDFNTPNEGYLSKVLKVSQGESWQETVVREGNSNYQSLLTYFRSKIQFGDNEKIVLLIVSSKKEPAEALLFGTQHNYYVNTDQLVQFDFDQLYGINYETEKAFLLNDKINCLELVLKDGSKINTTSLFAPRGSSNYAISKTFVNAVKECIESTNEKRKNEEAEKAKAVAAFVYVLNRYTASGNESQKNEQYKTRNSEISQNDNWKNRYDLAVQYEEGNPEIRNTKAAVAIYKELAEMGIPEAQWRLGRCYKSGTGIEKNVEKAVELFSKAAKQGNTKAMGALGNLYSSLTKKEWEIDDQKSLYWWTKAAKRGNEAAQFNLSIYYNTIQKDSDIRLFWLKKAAKNGHEIAQNKLGEFYLYGTDVEKDYSTAVYWFEQSAKNGYAHGQYSFGICYANGLGVEKSIDKAKYWFSEASKQGHKDANKELKRLEDQDRCYITTAVCESFGKDNNCYELQMFRKFRDNWLKRQKDGDRLIQEYYQTAPIIVKNIQRQPNADIIFQNIWDQYLCKCLMYIENEEYEKCKDLYISMVDQMKEKYVDQE